MVGRDGTVIATDPSVGMLARAKGKLSHYNNPSNVQFCRAAAENIPFPDDTFDAVIGMLFLHFTDIPKAFEETRRVIKSGGSFTTLYGVDFSKDKQGQFFSEWFEPVFERGITSKNSTVLPDVEFVSSIAGKYFERFECQPRKWMSYLSDVEDVVKILVQAGTMAELNELPWGARNRLFQELIDRGHSVKKKYGADEMATSYSGQLFKGIVEK